MLDFSSSELLLIVVVAIVVIGPKDLPRAMRVAGQWIARMRRVSGHFRAGIETMIREAELAEMEQKWREQNEAIMKQYTAEPATPAEAALPSPSPVDAVAVAEPVHDPARQEHGEPQLPLPPP